jgi:SAM-dependent methyltransferase
VTAPSALARFRAEYGAHRASEGRAHGKEELLALPYLAAGPLARQWAVRARSFDAFVRHVLAPSVRETRTAGRPLRVLDVGAGNAWLAWRAALAGCDAVAVDLRDDDVDGLAAARRYLTHVAPPGGLARVAGSFQALPLADAAFDVVVFNASLHYATDLAAALAEARRVASPGGRIVVLDSPFYAREVDGAAMVAEKRRDAAARFGARAEALLALPFVEYLTPARLAAASGGLAWRRRRVRYPLWYELRPLVARLRGGRRPSRFDLWEARVA